MKNDILIFGEGLISQRVKDAFKCNVSKREINTFADAEGEIKKYRPKIIINCIDHIGRSADDCELKKDKALFENTFAPIILSETSLRNNIKFVHISSGCIFHFDYLKNKPFTETRIPDFFDLFYSRAKIYADSILKLLSGKFNFLILRIRIPLDDKPDPKNLLSKLINYKRVIDTPNSITYIPDFIRALRHLIKINARGIYNVVNSGSLRYPKLMQIYKKYKPDFNYEIVNFKDLNLVRTNILLSARKLAKTGFKVRNINEVLEECVKTYIQY